MILIRFKGEQLLVESTKGYPRAKVIDRDVPHPPSDHCCWEDGAWCEDAGAKAKAAARARLNAMSRGELVEHVLSLVKGSGAGEGSGSTSDE